jgi:formylglycine-generating enzyme required for sulfatase activity
MNTPRPRRTFVFALAATLVCLLSFAPPPASTAQQPPQGETRGLDMDNQPLTTGRYYALVIGNNAYQHAPHLQTAEADAQALEATLRTRYSFQTRLLLNATREQVIAVLFDYRRELAEDANLLIYYAGHGYRDDDAGKTYWLPVDATTDNSANWISADDITTSIKAIRARHVLIISDSCYSGTLTRDFKPTAADPKQRIRYLRLMLTGRSRTLMAAGGNEPVADGGGNGHSIFAAALLRGLNQIDKDYFTAEELFHGYVKESVAGNARQLPEYSLIRDSGHDSGDFIFALPQQQAATPPPLSVGNSLTTGTGGRVAPGSALTAALDTVKRLEAPSGNAPGVVSGNASDARNSGAGGAGRTTPGASNAALPADMLRSYEYATLTLDAQAKPKPRETKRGTRYVEALDDDVTLEMVAVAGGTYAMGSPEGEGDSSERPQHRVAVPGFYMGKYEVTQAQWRALMGTNPANFKGDDLPVEGVSWNDAMQFCKRLTQMTGRPYRLPTEAEWEYAARAGTPTPFAFGTTIIAELVNYNGTLPYRNAPVGADRESTIAVGSLGVANAFGLYDMHGNVAEWCSDNWHDSYGGPAGNVPADGSAWAAGGDQKHRVARGGSWDNDGDYCRSALRIQFSPGTRHFFLGFRVVAAIQP